MSERETEHSLIAAALLYTIVGGYLDAYSYLAHGHVFANAQTGNVVLFAVDIFAGNSSHAIQHLPPIAAFIAGIILVTWIKVRFCLQPAQLRSYSSVVELLVLTFLLVAGHRLPNLLVVPSISFAAAIQVTSFQAVSNLKFNSAMTTGNLRAAISGMTLWLLGRDPHENREKFLVVGAVCVFFLLGALIGGLCTKTYPDYALVPCLITVVIAAVWSRRDGSKAVWNAYHR